MSKERLEEIMDKIAYVRDEYLDDKAVSEYYGRDIISEIVGCPISALSCTGDYIELLQKRVQELEEQNSMFRNGLIDLEMQNKRYREAIKKALEEEEQNLEGYQSTVHKILKEALEESE